MYKQKINLMCRSKYQKERDCKTGLEEIVSPFKESIDSIPKQASLFFGIGAKELASVWKLQKHFNGHLC